MGKLVSPEEMHEFLMSLPSDVLEKKSQEVKGYLNTVEYDKYHKGWYYKCIDKE